MEESLQQGGFPGGKIGLTALLPELANHEVGHRGALLGREREVEADLELIFVVQLSEVPGSRPLIDSGGGEPSTGRLSLLSRSPSYAA